MRYTNTISLIEGTRTWCFCLVKNHWNVEIGILRKIWRASIVIVFVLVVVVMSRCFVSLSVVLCGAFIFGFYRERLQITRCLLFLVTVASEAHS